MFCVFQELQLRRIAQNSTATVSTNFHCIFNFDFDPEHQEVGTTRLVTADLLVGYGVAALF